MTNTRQADYPIDPQFLSRWSPRAFDEAPVSETQVLTLLEAARWAPSSFNVQPWRFLYARRDTSDWARFLALLAPFNQSWARNAGALVFILSDTVMTTPQGETKPSHSHSFDAGAGWVCLALEAERMGLRTHAMTGVDFPAAQAELSVPERFRIECAIAIGHHGDPATLPEGLRAREVPSGRRPLGESAFAGNFPASP